MRVHAILVAVALALPVGGCLGQEPPKKVRYALGTGRPGEPVEAHAGVARIARVRVSSLFERKGFVYRTGEDRFERDFYNEFYAPPGSLVRERTGVWLGNSGLFDSVVDATDPAPTDWIIEGWMEQFYVDARAKPPEIVVKIEYTVLDARSVNLDPVFQNTYQRRLPAESLDSEDLVSTWAEILTQILTEFEADLRESPVAVPREDVRQ